MEDAPDGTLAKSWLELCSKVLNFGKGADKTNKLDEFIELSRSLLDILDNGLSDEWMNEVCQQLVALFRSKTKVLCRLVLELMPSLIWCYLSAAQSSRSKSLSGLEACLLTIYNLTLAYDSSSDKETPFIAIPSLGRSSVYHEVGHLAGLALTESTLSKYEPGEKRLPIGPFPLVEKLNAKNRLPVLSHIIRCYCKEIGLLSSRSHQSLCALSIKVCCTGFNTYLSNRLLLTPSAEKNSLISRPRIVISPEFLCEALHANYYIMFNGQPELGLEALNCIHQRANYELYTQVILLSNAIKNSLEHNPSGQPYDGPMGVSITITPAHILSSLNKRAITNASFRTRKLPDDITPEGDGEFPSDTEVESKTISAGAERQGKLLGGIRIGTNPLKSALKRVTLKKSTEHKDANPSPSKGEKNGDKFDSPTKLVKQLSIGKERLGNNHEMASLMAGQSEEEFDDIANGHTAQIESFHTVVDHENIDIVIDPPEETENSKL
ncbi:hyccin 2-like [Watersipora subatra]|uniref:hyccin 2-like n=1 Tax=Watersipora subatra TaxID=2589382 RepID=UPI00355AFAC2